MKNTISLVLVLALGLSAEVANADFAFGEPTNLGPIVNSLYGDCEPDLSADSLELYFISTRPGGFGDRDLYVATRETTGDDWGTPVNLGSPPNSQYGAYGPSITADGLELYFSDGYGGNWHPGGYGDADVWVTTRKTTNDSFGPYENIGPNVNSENAWFPDISADGLELYITSHRSGSIGECDLWVATRKTRSEPFGVPTHLGLNVNSSPPDGAPDISLDGLTLFFSRGPGSIGNLWVARRKSTSEPFGTAVRLPDHVNSAYKDGWPCLSPDGSTLYFCSGRPGGYGAGDIYQAPIIPIVDFNVDGIVNIKDIVILTEHWGENYPLCDIGPTPLGDGIVDIQDLVVLTEYIEPIDRTLIAHWALDEIEGDIASDSANDNDGTVYGDPAWQPEGGTVDGALHLDGIDDYISTPFVLNPADGKFSVFAWIKGGAPGQVVLSQIGGVNWLCADTLEGNLMTGLKATGRGAAALLSQAVITDGNWHRIGLVWDGSHRTLYVDDIAVAEDAQTNLLGSENGLYIGTGKAMEQGSFWSGLIDDVRIYNRAVTP